MQISLINPEAHTKEQILDMFGEGEYLIRTKVKIYNWWSIDTNSCDGSHGTDFEIDPMYEGRTLEGCNYDYDLVGFNDADLADLVHKACWYSKAVESYKDAECDHHGGWVKKGWIYDLYILLDEESYEHLTHRPQRSPHRYDISVSTGEMAFFGYTPFWDMTEGFMYIHACHKGKWNVEIGHHKDYVSLVHEDHMDDRIQEDENMWKYRLGVTSTNIEAIQILDSSLSTTKLKQSNKDHVSINTQRSCIKGLIIHGKKDDNGLFSSFFIRVKNKPEENIIIMNEIETLHSPVINEDVEIEQEDPATTNIRENSPFLQCLESSDDVVDLE